ncbi:MAG: M12 family metallo-peptidase [Sideroxyarcus sp.]|nr:M12 family metallo-peptidase [Sideroxyarcus sp.]
MILAIGIAVDACAETIGIRFVASEDPGRGKAQQQATQAALERYVSELNGYYRDSGVALYAQIVGVEFSRIEAVEAEQILEDMAHERNGFPAMFQRADEMGADYTIAVTRNMLIRGKRLCGRGYAVNQTVEAISSTRKAFAVINPVCGAHTLAHELGHLMGLNHGSLVDSCKPKMGHTSAIAPYANGYAMGNCDGKPQPGEFGDIMVGGWMGKINGNDKSSLRMFSNPRIHDERCGANKTCGNIAIGDAARALNENAHYYAAHEEPDVHTLRYGSAELYACINRYYRGKEIEELEEIVCPNFGIGDIAGIERLTALRRIDLSSNQIEDASPLGKLPPDRVDGIDLRRNNRISCKSLNGLDDKFPGKVLRPTSCSG